MMMTLLLLWACSPDRPRIAVCEGYTSPDAYYLDDDADGFGVDETREEHCERPSGYASLPGDCDDADSTAFPGASEVCDGVDQDCDGSVDEGVLLTFYADTDGDGHGDASAVTESCTAPSGHVSIPGDCDDANAAVHPGATESCDAVDSDCDGLMDDLESVDAIPSFLDGDGDGYGDPKEPSWGCGLPTGYVSPSGDCDDANAAVHPGATEVCDGVDQDCDGSVDEDALSVRYADKDGDGHGAPDDFTIGCDVPPGYVDSATDCDDTDEDVNPDAIEDEDWWTDLDCDGDPEAGSLVITEVMVNGPGSDEEWIEVCCLAPEGCDLAGLSLSWRDPDNDFSETKVSVFTGCEAHLDSGQYAVFYTDVDDPSLLGGMACEFKSTGFSNENSLSLVLLQDGVLQDRVEWDAPKSDGFEESVSFCVDPLALALEDPAVETTFTMPEDLDCEALEEVGTPPYWGRSTVSYGAVEGVDVVGSPGAENEACDTTSAARCSLYGV